VVQRRVGGDPVEPCALVRALGEPSHGHPGPQHRLLEQILRDVVVAHDPPDVASQFLAVLGEQPRDVLRPRGAYRRFARAHVREL
jgi:hypothetical protein